MKSLFFSLLFLWGCQSSKAQGPSQRFSILQGATGADKVQFSIVHEKKLVFSPHILPPPPGKIQAQRFEREDSLYAVTKVWASELPAGKQTRALELRGSQGELLERRFFQLWRPPTGPLRILVASCLNQRKPYQKSQGRIWAEAISQGPKAIFLLGDNIYADRGGPASPSRLWETYVQSRLSLGLYSSSHLIPTYAIWDDHDYGQDNGDSGYSYKEESLEIFQTFFAQPKGPWGAGHNVELEGISFSFLDGRFFRRPPGQGVPLGPEQQAHLLDHLQTHPNKKHVLILGYQFFTANTLYESYEGLYPRAFQSFLEKIRQSGAPVLFLSGDRHVTELLKVGPLYEFTTGPIHARVYPQEEYQEEFSHPRVLEARAGLWNYGILNFHPPTKGPQGPWTVTVESWGLGPRKLFQRELHIVTGIPKV